MKSKSKIVAEVAASTGLPVHEATLNRTPNSDVIGLPTQPALWFAPYLPDEEGSYYPDIAQKGYHLVGVYEGAVLGKITINSDHDLSLVASGLRELARRHSATAVFGNFPPELLALFNGWSITHGIEDSVPCFASWQVRLVEDPEFFTHKEWVQVSGLYIDELA